MKLTGLRVRSWAALGTYVAGLGALLGLLAVLGRSWGCMGGLEPLFVASVPGLGLLLEPMFAVLGRSWALCWRSWAALGAYVGGLGLLWRPKLAVLGADQGLSWRSWGQSGRSWKRSRRKVAQTRAGKRSGKRGTPGAPEPSECPYAFFL